MVAAVLRGEHQQARYRGRPVGAGGHEMRRSARHVRRHDRELQPACRRSAGARPGRRAAPIRSSSVVRMPAFGVSGPWRDRVGFAQTIEQASGLAYLTGYEGETPVIPNGMCDPIAGVYGAIAALVGLAEREHRTRPGRRVADGRRRAATWRPSRSSSSPPRAAAAEHGQPVAVRRTGRVACRGDDDWVAITLPNEETATRSQKATGAAESRRARGRGARRGRSGGRGARRKGSACRRPGCSGRTSSSTIHSSRAATSSRTSATPSRGPIRTSRSRRGSGPGRTVGTAPAPTFGDHNDEVLAELGY